MEPRIQRAYLQWAVDGVTPPKCACRVLVAPPSLQFISLFLVWVLLTLVCGVSWKSAVDTSANADHFDYFEALYMAVQVTTSAGYDSDITSPQMKLVYLAELVGGLVIFAILVGFITDAVTGFMASLSSGRTKVVAEGHTLIVGESPRDARAVRCSVVRFSFPQAPSPPCPVSCCCVGTPRYGTHTHTHTHTEGDRRDHNGVHGAILPPGPQAGTSRCRGSCTRSRSCARAMRARTRTAGISAGCRRRRRSRARRS